MYEKYKACEFGRCPRVLCNGQPCLPVGTCDVPRQSTVKIFCPKCQDIYYPRSKYQVTPGVPQRVRQATFPALGKAHAMTSLPCPAKALCARCHYRDRGPDACVA